MVTWHRPPAAGTDINVRDMYGRTALHFACDDDVFHLLYERRVQQAASRFPTQQHALGLAAAAPPPAAAGVASGSHVADGAGDDRAAALPAVAGGGPSTATHEWDIPEAHIHQLDGSNGSGLGGPQGAVYKATYLSALVTVKVGGVR